MVLVDELTRGRFVIPTTRQMKICSSIDFKDSKSKSIVKHDTQQGAIDFQPVLGVDEAQFLELVHE